MAVVVVVASQRGEKRRVQNPTVTLVIRKMEGNLCKKRIYLTLQYIETFSTLVLEQISVCSVLHDDDSFFTPSEQT